MKRLNIMISMLETTESHLAQRVSTGDAAHHRALEHDFIQLYRTRAKLTELRQRRGDALYLNREVSVSD